MHMINKITHLIRGNFFRITIVLLMVIYLYKIGSGTNNMSAHGHSAGSAGSLDLDTLGNGGETDRKFLELFLKNRVSGDKLIHELELKKQQSFLNGNYVGDVDGGDSRKDKLKAASKKLAEAMEKLKKIKNKPTPTSKPSVVTEDGKFDIRDLTYRNDRMDDATKLPDPYADENDDHANSKGDSSSNSLENNNNLTPTTDTRNKMSKPTSKSTLLNKKSSKTKGKKLLKVSNKITKTPKSHKDNTEKPDQKMMKIFADNKLRTNFTSKEEMVEYIARMNRVNNKPIFAYLNMRWNSGGSADYYKRDITTETPAGKNLCYNWTYNAADYTLVYKPSKWYQDEPCPLPVNETIKKIVLPNKGVVWKGCTRKTPSCSEAAFFDEEKGVRRNVPPCCRRHLLEMLGNIDRELTRRNITYTLTDGVVIGWYRNQKLVPYDADLDMYIDGTYYKTRIWDEVFGNLTKKYGYQYLQIEDYKFKLQYSAKNGLTVDIWPYFNIKLRTQYGLIKPGEWLTFVYHSGTTAMRVSEFFPPKRTTIEGVPCSVPRDVVHYLNLNFGPTPDHWMTELTCKKKKLYNCIN